MPFNLGFGEILVILLVALLVFGGRLPEVGRSLGRSMKEFKDGLKDTTPLDDEEEDEKKIAGPAPDAAEGEDGSAAGGDAFAGEPDSATPASSDKQGAPSE